MVPTSPLSGQPIGLFLEAEGLDKPCQPCIAEDVLAKKCEKFWAFRETCFCQPGRWNWRRIHVVGQRGGLYILRMRSMVQTSKKTNYLVAGLVRVVDYVLVMPFAIRRRRHDQLAILKLIQNWAPASRANLMQSWAGSKMPTVNAACIVRENKVETL